MSTNYRQPVRGYINDRQVYVPVAVLDKMPKSEYYAQMRVLLAQYFGEDFREHRLEIKKRLRAGEAPEINRLYQKYTYGQRAWAYIGNPYRMAPVMYNLWDYDRINKLWKYL